MTVDRYVLAGLALLAVLGGAVIRWRVLHGTGRVRVRLTDQDILTILREGTLAVDEDEPLDLDLVREAEERFWSETWDEADDP